jgi:hypothetical protein
MVKKERESNHNVSQCRIHSISKQRRQEKPKESDEKSQGKSASQKDKMVTLSRNLHFVANVSDTSCSEDTPLPSNAVELSDSWCFIL